MQKIKIKNKGVVYRMSAILLSIATIIAAMLPIQVFAWGPERPTYTMANPADHVTFNSITDNNVLGDERNFVRVAEAGASGTFKDEIEIKPGKEYEVYIGYHNNASASLNTTAQGGVGIALDTKLSTQFPAKVTPAQK